MSGKPTAYTRIYPRKHSCVVASAYERMFMRRKVAPRASKKLVFLSDVDMRRFGKPVMQSVKTRKFDSYYRHMSYCRALLQFELSV
jgi:hypothetical protein